MCTYVTSIWKSVSTLTSYSTYISPCFSHICVKYEVSNTESVSSVIMESFAAQMIFLFIFDNTVVLPQSKEKKLFDPYIIIAQKKEENKTLRAFGLHRSHSKSHTEACLQATQLSLTGSQEQSDFCPPEESNVLCALCNADKNNSKEKTETVLSLCVFLEMFLIYEKKKKGKENNVLYLFQG